MSQNLPDLSVITVVLNDKDGLTRAIKSVKQQHGVTIEHIIVDGGSTDGSAQIAIENSSQKIESKPDGGIYPAMHRGAQVATGEFIIFCNAGDSLFGLNYIGEAISQLRKSKAVWGFGPIIEHTQRGTFAWVAADQKATTDSIIARKCFVPFPSFILNRIFYTKIGPLSARYRIAGDFELICKAAFIYPPVIFKEPIALFSAGGISYTRADLAWKEEIQIRTEILQFDLVHRIYEWIKYFARVLKWKAGKFLDLLEKFLPFKESWRDKRAAEVPVEFRHFLPKDL